MFDDMSTGDWQLAALVAILVIVAAIAVLLTFRLERSSRPASDSDASTSGNANPFVRLLHAEPALVAGVVSAVAALGAAFGLSLDAEQVAAVVALLNIVLAIAVRATVYAPATVAASGLAFDESDGTLKRRVR